MPIRILRAAAVVGHADSFSARFSSGRTSGEKMKSTKDNRSEVSSVALPLALFLSASAVFALLYASNALVAARPGIIVQFDVACAGFFSGFRTPALMGFFSIVTAFGYWGVVLAMATAVSILLWLGRRSQYVVSLWIVLAGNQISVNVLKAIFARARPELAYYSESSYSFPSGHSAVSVAFFGFMMYLVTRERIVAAGIAVTVGVLAILLIGMSRLVLDVHYLSDVLSGYLVGAVWALFGIWLVARGRSPAGAPSPVSQWRRSANFAVILAAALCVSLLASNYQHNLVLLPVSGLTP